MKFKTLFAGLLVLCTVLAGCGKESKKDPAGTLVYELQSIAMEEQVMDKAALDSVSGGAYLYLKLFPDGSAEMRVTSEKVLKMEYNGSSMWRPETPDLLAPYTTEGDVLTLYDGASVYIFDKNP